MTGSGVVTWGGFPPLHAPLLVVRQYVGRQHVASLFAAEMNESEGWSLLPGLTLSDVRVSFQEARVLRALEELRYERQAA